MGIPETGKAGKAIDGALERISRYRDELAAECARHVRLEWAILYVSTVAELMVNAPESDRVKFAAEIHEVSLDLDLLPEPRTIARPAELQQPWDEGEWILHIEDHIGED